MCDVACEKFFIAFEFLEIKYNIKIFGILLLKFDCYDIEVEEFDFGFWGLVLLYEYDY